MRNHLGMIGLAALVIAAGARSHPYGSYYDSMGFRHDDPPPPVRMNPKALDLTGALDPKPKGKRGKRRRKHALSLPGKEVAS